MTVRGCGWFRLADVQPVFKVQYGGPIRHDNKIKILIFYKFRDRYLRLNKFQTMNTRGKVQERDFITVAIPGSYDNDKGRRGKISLWRVCGFVCLCFVYGASVLFDGSVSIRSNCTLNGAVS